MCWLRKISSVKPILQFSATECGVASLAMLFSYYHLHISMEVLRERCGASRDGTKASTLIEVAESFGFMGSAYRVELEDIAAIKKPVIAFWRFHHYVVIKGVGKNKIYINDPALGPITVNPSEFDKYFTGIIIDLEPTDRVIPVRRIPTYRPMISAWLSERISAFCFLLTCMLLTIMTPLMNTKLSSVFIDYCIIGQNDNWLPSLAVFATTLGVVLLIALRLQKIVQFRLTMKSSIIKSANIMNHVLKLPLLFFSLRHKPEVVAILMRAEAVASTLFQSLSNALINSIMVLVTFIFLLYADRELTFLIMLQLVLFVCLTRVLTALNYHYGQMGVTHIGKYYNITLSTLKNIETIKTIGAESNSMIRWLHTLYDKISVLDKSVWIFLLLDTSSQSFQSISTVITLCVGGFKVANGALSVGGLMTFYGLQIFLSNQIIAIIHAVKNLQNSMAIESRINDLLHYQTDKRFHQDQLIMQQHHCNNILSCRSLSFSYNHAALPVLSNINLDILPKQHVAFVGGTGSGKSTLVKILAHLYFPSSGSVLFHGKDYQQGGELEFSAHFAYVSQEVSLFSGTIYDNLTMWRTDVPMSLIDAAICDACLDDLIQQRGLYGKVEEGGCNFSGGERQRLEIARAIIQSPSILVLDEATAALDVVTEETIINQLRTRNVTIIFIAHRLNTVRHCDQIFVMEQGRIVEQGCHEDLILKQSHYHRLLSTDAGRACRI